MREIRRTVSLFSRIEQDVLEIALYQPGTLEPTTKRAGYTYAGELKELRLRGERLTQSLFLDLWVQRANNERLPLRTRIELQPAQDLNLLELLTPRDYYKLGSEIQLGLTLSMRFLSYQQALVVDGWADETGYAVGSEDSGSLGLAWGEISGVLDDQEDLATALDNRTSRAELDAYRNATDAAIAALEDQVGAIDGLTQSEADALYRHQSALITAEDIEGPLLDSQIPQGITRDAELAQILGGYATTQALNAIAGVSQQQLDQAIASETQARTQAIASESTARNAAIAAESSARQQADIAQYWSDILTFGEDDNQQSYSDVNNGLASAIASLHPSLTQSGVISQFNAGPWTNVGAWENSLKNYLLSAVGNPPWSTQLHKDIAVWVKKAALWNWETNLRSQVRTLRTTVNQRISWNGTNYRLHRRRTGIVTKTIPANTTDFLEFRDLTESITPAIGMFLSASSGSVTASFTASSRTITQTANTDSFVDFASATISGISPTRMARSVNLPFSPSQQYHIIGVSTDAIRLTVTAPATADITVSAYVSYHEII